MMAAARHSHVFDPDAATGGLRLLALWLLCLFVFTLPWEDQWVIGSFGTFSRLAGACAMGGGVLVALARGSLRMIRPVHLWLILFVLWGAVSRVWTPYPATVAAATRTYLQLLAMVWLIHEYAPGWAEQRRVLQAFVLGTLVSSASTIATYLQGAAGPFYQRYAAEGFDPNDLCVIFALSIPMSVYFGLAERSRMVWIWRLHPIPVLIAAALTASRGGFVAIAVSLLTIPALLPRLPLMRKLAAVLFLAGAFVAVVAVAPESSFERIATLPGDAGSRSLGDRVPIWRAGLEVYREHPVLGTGLGTFAEAVQPVLGYAVVAHNVFLTLLAETGLAGAGLFLLALGSLVRDVTRFPPVDRRLWSIVLLTWLAGSFSLSWAHRKPTWFLFAMIAARAVSLRSEQGGGGND